MSALTPMSEREAAAARAAHEAVTHRHPEFRTQIKALVELGLIRGWRDITIIEEDHADGVSARPHVR
jgi:hypothetical protein